MGAYKLGFSDVNQRSLVKPIHHVFYSCDSSHIAGLIASVNSVIRYASEPERLRIYLVGREKMRPTFEEASNCINARTASLEILSLNSKDHPIIANVQDADFSNMVRFYISDLFPYSTSILWADADVIFKDDVVSLMDSLFQGNQSTNILAGHYRQHKKFVKAVSIPPDVLKVLGLNKNTIRSKGIINAGVTFFNAPEWRKRNLSSELERMLAVFERHKFSRYDGMSKALKYSSQTPLVLLMYKYGMECLDKRWNLEGLGWKMRDFTREDVANAAALHWSGMHKPWLKSGWYFRSEWINQGQFIGGDSRCPNVKVSLDFDRSVVANGSKELKSAQKFYEEQQRAIERLPNKQHLLISSLSPLVVDSKP